MKNKEFVRAWLDGEKVEYFIPWKGWQPLPDVEDSSGCPTFSDQFDYRIAPKIIYRYFNIYPSAYAVSHYPVDSLKEVNARVTSHHDLRTHILKIGSDGSVELLKTSNTNIGESGEK